MNIINTICKSDSNANVDLHIKLLNGFVNFKNYIENIFVIEMSKENKFSLIYGQFKNGNHYI